MTADNSNLMASKLRPICMKCFTTFDTKSKYKSHYCYFSKNYVCTTCWTEFKNIVHFYKHIYQKSKECIGCLKRQRELATKLEILPSELIKHKCFAKKNSKDKTKKCLICANVEINQSCPDCLAKFSTNLDLQCHINDCRIYKYICVECWNLFDSDEKLREHISDNCTKCWLGMEPDQLKHISVAHTKNPKIINTVKLFDSKYCDYSSKTSNIHKPFKCEQCKFSSVMMNSLRRHKRTHTGVKPFKCTQCDYASTRKDCLKIHKRTHSDVKPFNCNNCDYSATSMYKLRRHEVTHAILYKCEQCDYSTMRKNDFEVHKLTHSGVEIFNCIECNYSSISIAKLRRHELKHRDVKPFKCKECDYSTKVMSHLRTHELRHSDFKPFKCNECGYSTARKDSLRVHQLTHASVKPFKCKYCNFSSKWKQNLQTHELNHGKQKETITSL